MLAGAGGAGGVGYSRKGRPGFGDHKPGALNAWSAAALIQIRQCRISLDHLRELPHRHQDV